MSFQDLAASLHSIVDDTATVVDVTFHFPDGSPDITIVDVPVKNPTLEVDFVPGSVEGVGVILLRLSEEKTEGVTLGNTATIESNDYDVFDVSTSRVGSKTIRLKKRARPWNQ